MHNHPSTLGLNHHGEPSETLSRLDTMLRAATHNTLGVRDVRKRGDELEVDTLLVPRGPEDEERPKTFRFSVPTTFVAWSPEVRAAYVVGALYVYHLRGPDRGTPSAPTKPDARPS